MAAGSAAVQNKDDSAKAEIAAASRFEPDGLHQSGRLP
jgi:hypothetical protein